MFMKTGTFLIFLDKREIYKNEQKHHSFKPHTIHSIKRMVEEIHRPEFEDTIIHKKYWKDSV